MKKGEQGIGDRRKTMEESTKPEAHEILQRILYLW